MDVFDSLEKNTQKYRSPCLTPSDRSSCASATPLPPEHALARQHLHLRPSLLLLLKALQLRLPEPCRHPAAAAC